MDVIDYFQRLYIINLPARADRKREMQAQLVSIGLSLDHSKVQLFTAIRPKAAGDFPSIGARGCFLSHLGVLKDAERRGLERILILEDDLNFSADFQARIPRIIDGLANSEWGVFYGGYQLTSPLTKSIDSDLALVTSPEGVLTTHFIGFQRTTISLLIAYLEKMLSRPGGDAEGGPMHVDGAYSWFRRQHPDLVTLAAVPELGFQRSSRTDIHELRWFDKWVGVRDLVRIARKRKTKL